MIVNEKMAVLALALGYMYFKNNDTPDFNNDGVTDGVDKMWLAIGAIVVYLYLN